ncbi:reverse transcriptase domain-containing protein [uncultured Aliiroseovarius sp.]|uniref:reverse transcriptase domain-containing protein n=1 Tax=uncultured Aliiroseovarius sp. TaxID=1658783 RepID=UPI002639C3CC|nr:reverse transcriptase domain-containing protein [uncultured Aliiroseovarius sp.]
MRLLENYQREGAFFGSASLQSQNSPIGFAKLRAIGGQKMFEQLCHVDTLHLAWKKVRSNGGATGGDGETAREFSRNLEMRILALSSALRKGRYRPGRLATVKIRKPNGQPRLLRIPGLADRVAQTSCHMVLSTKLDRRMSRDSFAYRPARSVRDALNRLDKLAPRNAWVLDADIRAFFDRVPHGPLQDELGIWISDPRIMHLIMLWLRSFGKGRSLAQGAPISPLLANMALHPLDMAFSFRDIPFVRYADDFVALGKSRKDVDRVRAVAQKVLRRRGLELNHEKTQIMKLSEGIHFLGQDCRWKTRPSWKSSARSEGGQPRKPLT